VSDIYISVMLRTEKNSDAMVDTTEHRSRYCALRMVGRAGYQLASSRRRKAQHCSSAAPFRHRHIIKKPAVRKIRPKSAAREDSHVDNVMYWLSDHTYLSKSNYRRSSLPMDYRWLAGMTPKCYSNPKRQRSVMNQQETADGHLGRRMLVQKNTHMTSCKSVLDEELDHRNRSPSLLALLTTDSFQSVNDRNIFLLGPVPVSMAHCSEPVCRSSTCDCLSFCDSSSNEHKADTAQKKNTAVDGSVTYAGYLDCSGSHKVTCDLHLVGAVETVPDSTLSASCIVNRRPVSAVDHFKREDFVDNICVDCGCELTCDDMIDCAYSVPICTICSLVSSDCMPSVDSDVMAEHGYACMSADHLACLHPLRATPSSSYAICQQPEAPDVDIVDDITFLSFPSKLLMHRYILTQRNNCDSDAKSSWMEMARCERAWHAGHKSHRKAWFGSVKHRHMDRFSAHNRLNEQIELGLVRPVSAQNSAELCGIKLKPCLPHNNSVVGRKYQRRHMPNDLRVQRPTRMAAKGQYYSLTHFRQKGIVAPRTLLEAEHVDIMKLTRHQAEAALKLLHIPSLITRNNCNEPGIFNLIQHVF